jgi:tetratricopeptide (TPR) repeat protein
LKTSTRQFATIQLVKKGNIIQTALALLLASTLAAPSLATCGGGGGGGVGGLGGMEAYYVPWRHVRSKEEVPGNDALLLFWFPVSDAEYQKSTLRYSRSLALYASRCTSLCIVDNLSSPMGKEYAPDGQSVALLMQADGHLLGRVTGNGGPVVVQQVEQLVGDEYKKRDDLVKAAMDAGDDKAKSGDAIGAIAEYKKVVEQKCMFSKHARDAARRLKKLGVTDVGMIPDSPDFDAAVGNRIAFDLKEAIADEMKDDYVAAEKLYEAAHKLDPADPTPLRYLGELYRHELGDWDKANTVFNEILKLHADPLSQAVALHGIGKMTIHNGEFKKGVGLIEQSVAIYPLAMAYRNLAVYWNSEGNPSKAAQYTEKALKEEPKDPFNIVFAATFMAANGKGDEALKIARENENLMPASYNPAAIYTQTGNKEKALALLKRHFFQYERYKSVRAKEMMEARVDKFFEPLIHDEQFLALTSGADGRLPMRGETESFKNGGGSCGSTGAKSAMPQEKQ